MAKPRPGSKKAKKREESLRLMHRDRDNDVNDVPPKPRRGRRHAHGKLTDVDWILVGVNTGNGRIATIGVFGLPRSVEC